MRLNVDHFRQPFRIVCRIAQSMCVYTLENEVCASFFHILAMKVYYFAIKVRDLCIILSICEVKVRECAEFELRVAVIVVFVKKLCVKCVFVVQFSV